MLRELSYAFWKGMHSSGLEIVKNNESCVIITYSEVKKNEQMQISATIC